MEHAYVKDIAEQLKVDYRGVSAAIDELGIRTLQTAVPPYGAQVAAAVSHADAERLRRYLSTRREREPAAASG